VEIFVLFFTAMVVAMSGAMMPGPLLTVTISRAATRGRWLALLLIVGHGFLELILIIALLLGFGQIFENPSVTRLVGVIGGLFILWMGINLIRDSINSQVPLEIEGNNYSSRLGPTLEGAAVSLANPYWTLWWATIGVKFLTISLKYKIIGLFSFFTGHILGDFIWYGLVAFLVAGGKHFLSERVYQGVLLTCGIFLLALAVIFIFNIHVF
jgi:threonine/homoserine/homoserine lactone efflux protein